MYSRGDIGGGGGGAGVRCAAALFNWAFSVLLSRAINCAQNRPLTLTLIVVPTIYEILDGVRAFFGKRLGFSTPMTGEHKVPAGAMPQPVMGD